jgi:fumarate reductase subunit D
VKKFLLRIEPVIWLLFGGGIMVGTMLLPAWLLTVGLAGPLGLLPADALSYERLHGILTTPLLGIVAKGVLVALAALPLWKGAHHLRHFLIDVGGHGSDAVVAPLLYLIALAGSVLALVGAFGIA